jgi:DNA topoisomerase-1
MAVLALPLDPLESARCAHLRHVNPDDLPGIRRTRSGNGFVYVDASGRRIRDARTIDRIQRIVIPPAWQNVWICPLAEGHIHAVGRDARGRKQYRYHPRWREVRDATKYHKMLAFADALRRIRASVRRDLRRRGLPRDKVLATAVRILDATHMRVGNEGYRRENGSYGLTTLRDRHVGVRGDDVRFHFRGKAGKMREIGLHDRQVARIVRACSELPGHELFHYLDGDGRLCRIDSSDVNEYIHRVAGQEFTAKDFRTWAGTVLAARTLRAMEPCLSQSHGKRAVTRCIQEVAAVLGNTPAVCRRCYVHPAVLDAYVDGSMRNVRARGGEAFVCALLALDGRRSPDEPDRRKRR